MVFDTILGNKISSGGATTPPPKQGRGNNV